MATVALCLGIVASLAVPGRPPRRGPGDHKAADPAPAPGAAVSPEAA